MPCAVILTALPIEYSAVRTHLTDLREETHPQGTIYERGRFLGNGQEWEVGIAEVGSGNAGAAVEAERAIAHFKPDILFFVGIAGGIKDVAIGDVVAATKVYSYESGKVGEQFFTRPMLGQSAHALVQRARAEARKDEWLRRLSTSSSDPQPRVFVAPIAAGEKVIASRESDVFNFIRASYNDAIAVEMEGFGFLSAVFAHQSIKAIVIRGISDLIDNKNDDSIEPEALRQEKASCHASAFTFEILAKLGSDLLPKSNGSNTTMPISIVPGIPSQSDSGYIVQSNLDYEPARLHQERTYERFIRRTDEVNRILMHLESSTSNKVIGLVGLGGIGKTALCHYVATKAYEQKILKRVIWIRAKKQQFDPLTPEEQTLCRESTLTFEQALKEISEQISGITNDVREDIERLQTIIRLNLTNIPSLVIIDGLEDMENPRILATKFKPVLGESRLILTTRKEINDYIFQLDVNKMSCEDSKEFLKAIAQDVNCEPILKAQEFELVKILEITDGMPLAMKLVVSHHAKYWKIDRIIERLSSVADEQRLYDYIFEDSWQELDERNAINAQSLLIHLSEDSEPTSIELLYGIKNAEGESLSKLQVDESIKLLKQFSLVEITNNIVSLHSLTAKFFGETLRSRYGF
jgi:nucleoside phosphorylase/molybdopterin-guanine dinucleotide biosynthesis protein